jgi:NAD(P)-dependent dehydrogenase (short-subunit alcohol dehydrogenase family)
MHVDFDGRVALVTGGSRGIGSAIVRGLASDGANVAFTYLSARERAERLVKELSGGPRTVRSYLADQADPAMPATLVGRVLEDFGRLDILVNNAAVAVHWRVDDQAGDPDALDRQVVVNYTSIVATVRAAAGVLPPGGRIISIGSGVAARTGAAGIADHAGTKAALGGFTRGAARDLAGREITVNLLQTGLVATDLNKAEGSAASRLIDSVALGRMGTPEEIVAGVLFLASPDASYVTGATLDIDGGYAA